VNVLFTLEAPGVPGAGSYFQILLDPEFLERATPLELHRAIRMEARGTLRDMEPHVVMALYRALEEGADWTVTP
jgi:hypothetical protein